jgi:hypothetical protein
MKVSVRGVSVSSVPTISPIHAAEYLAKGGGSLSVQTVQEREQVFCLSSTPTSETGPVSRPRHQAAYFVLVSVALCSACILFVRDKASFTMNLWVFAAAALFLWPSFARPRMAAAQAVTGLFLFFLPLGAATRASLNLGVSGRRVAFSAGIGIAVIVLVAYLISRSSTAQEDRLEGSEAPFPQAAWGGAYAVIAAHMGFLWVLLAYVYGYGYERSAAVMAEIGLFFLAFMALRKAWGRLCLRRVIGAILFATYALSAILKSGVWNK